MNEFSRCTSLSACTWNAGTWRNEVTPEDQAVGKRSSSSAPLPPVLKPPKSKGDSFHMAGPERTHVHCEFTASHTALQDEAALLNFFPYSFPIAFALASLMFLRLLSLILRFLLFSLPGKSCPRYAWGLFPLHVASSERPPVTTPVKRTTIRFILLSCVTFHSTCSCLSFPVCLFVSSMRTGIYFVPMCPILQ